MHHHSEKSAYSDVCHAAKGEHAEAESSAAAFLALFIRLCEVVPQTKHSIRSVIVKEYQTH